MRFSEDFHEGASVRLGYSIGGALLSISEFIKDAIAAVVRSTSWGR